MNTFVALAVSIRLPKTSGPEMPPAAVPTAKKQGDRQRARLHRKDLACRQVGGARACRSEEENDHPGQCLRESRQRARGEEVTGDRQQYPGENIGARDHLAQ
jgi:hypothetical protein